MTVLVILTCLEPDVGAILVEWLTYLYVAPSLQVYWNAGHIV